MKYAGIRILQLSYVLFALLLWPFLSTYVNNPDTFQYINIAQEYRTFHFSNAINGYWSPLISWLLLLFPLKGLQAIFSFKLLQLIIGFFAFSLWCRLSVKVISNTNSRKFLQWLAVPFLLSYAFLYLSADLLFLTVLLWMLDYFITRPIWNNTRRAIIAGIMASLLYFSKSFGFPMALLLLLLSVFHHGITSTRMSRYNLLQGFAVFLFMSGFWIFLLSSKYGHLTISEAARLNVTKEVSPLSGQTVMLPVVYSEGLIAPTTSTSLSAWEEPLQAVQLTDLHPLTSATDALKRLDVIQRNLLSIWYFDFRRQAGGLFLIIMILVLIFNRRIINLRDPFTFYSIAIIILIYTGYSLILYHARYSWICTLLMVLLGIKWSDSLFNSLSNGLKKLVWAVMLLFILIAVKRPVKELLFSQDESISASSLFSAILSPFQTMKQSYAEDRAIFETAAMLDTLPGTLASRYSSNLDRPRYFASLLVAQSCGQPYYGQAVIENAATGLSLKKNGIRYFLDWDHQEDSCFGHPPVFKNKTLSIFSADFSAKL